MKYPHIMESALITIPAVLCTLLLWKLIYNLRSALPWRVNCWFCNRNFWVKCIERNCWTCPKCEQYNGFTKDGDYNKVLSICNDLIHKSPKLERCPPMNGLCKMCNINQQLKVTQLANFVPINERKYDEEIDSYRINLEKAYRLCSPCKKVLQNKLHKEKETLLGSKLLESQTPEKRNEKNEKQSQLIKNIINTTSGFIAGILFVLVAIECYENALKHKSLSNSIYNVKEITCSLLERIISIVKMKTLLTFPSLEDQLVDINTFIDINIFTNFNSELNDLTQKALGGFVCFIQIIGHYWNINKAKYSILIDSLWSAFVVTSLVHEYINEDPLIMSLIKLSSTLAVLLVYRNLKNKTVKCVTRKNVAPKKLKNFGVSPKKLIDEEDNISLDTDDDVSLSKFGLHNLTDSSNDTVSPVNHSHINGRSFTPRIDSKWGKPKLNSTFCVNTALNNSLKSESVFIKPSFNKYQRLSKDESDSDLDESISSLCISSPKKKSSKINPVFALRKFTASPQFVAPTPLSRTRPLISPSKLGHTTSWVAGGYWGSEGERTIFNVNGSRSSSQSSGFESQASSVNQRNIFSQPPSREQSVCGDPDRMSFDRFQNCNANNYNAQSPPLFTPISTPVFPQMHYNSHVQIPQPRLAQTFVSQNVFAQQYVPNSIFKAPGGSRLIKLPENNSFMSH